MKTIFISAGHYPKDPGCQHPDSRDEHDLTLMLAYHVAACLQADLPPDVGCAVIYNWKLRQKTERINNSMLNYPSEYLAVEMHINSFTDSSPNGFEILYQKDSRAGLAYSAYIHRYISDFKADHPTDYPLNIRANKSRGDLHFLNNTDCPALILEHGFMSNDNDRKVMNDPVMLQNHADIYAEAIASAVSAVMNGDLDITG